MSEIEREAKTHNDSEIEATNKLRHCSWTNYESPQSGCSESEKRRLELILPGVTLTDGGKIFQTYITSGASGILPGSSLHKFGY